MFGYKKNNCSLLLFLSCLSFTPTIISFAVSRYVSQPFHSLKFYHTIIDGSPYCSNQLCVCFIFLEILHLLPSIYSSSNFYKIRKFPRQLFLPFKFNSSKVLLLFHVESAIVLTFFFCLLILN